jgi:hypothetical protein
MNGPRRDLVALTRLDDFLGLALDVKHKLAFHPVARFRTGMRVTANIYVRHDLSHSDNRLVIGARDIELLQRRTLYGRTLLCRRRELLLGCRDIQRRKHGNHCENQYFSEHHRPPA